MSVKNLVLIAAIIVVVISALAFTFFQEMIKESAPVTMPPAPKAAVEKQEPVYAVPENTVPPLSFIEESIKQSEAKKAETDQMITKAKADVAPKRTEIRVQLEAEAAAPKEETIASLQKTTAATTRVVVKNPTREERSAMKARGVIAY